MNFVEQMVFDRRFWKFDWAFLLHFVLIQSIYLVVEWWNSLFSFYWISPGPGIENEYDFLKKEI